MDAGAAWLPRAPADPACPWTRLKSGCLRFFTLIQRSHRPARHMSVMNRRHSSRSLRHRPTAPTTLSATSNLYSPRRQYCAAHECRDRQRDRNILLSKRLPGGSLKVVVASAPRDLRSYLLGRALYAEVREGLGFAPTPLKQKLRHEGRSCEAAGVHPANNYHFLTRSPAVVRRWRL